MKKQFVIILGCMLALFGVRASAQSSTSEFSPTLRVWIDDFTLTADGLTVGYLHISENDVRDYAGFQMRISVPKGLAVQKVKVGRNTYDVQPTDRFSSAHTAVCNMVASGQTINLAVISNPPTEFFPDDESGNPLDELCSIALTADPSMVNGEYSITMDDIKFMLTNAFAYIPESTTAATLTITGGQEPTVGLEQVKADCKSPIYYDLSGRAVKNPARGVYVKENKKVVVK